MTVNVRKIIVKPKFRNFTQNLKIDKNDLFL